MCAITLEQIKQLLDHPLIGHDYTIREVVKFAIIPATKGLGVGYALLINQDKPLKVRVMISVSNNNMIMHIHNSFFLFQVWALTHSIHFL